MRLVSPPLLALALTACTGALPGPGDDGGSPDLARAAGTDAASADAAGGGIDLAAGGGADLASGGSADLRLSCDSLSATVQAWLDAHASCKADADCGFFYTACGLPFQCGGYANVAAQDPQLAALESQWKLACPSPCPPCAAPDPTKKPGCVAGLCVAKAKAAPIGDPCGQNGECASGYCANEGNAKLFLGGYCTVIDCNLGGASCPADSACRPLDDGHSYCLKHCDPRLMPAPCRPAYACCGGAGPMPIEGWCAPAQSQLCR